MNENSIDFFTVLKNDQVRPLFESWLREDFSYENFAFWKDVEEYKQIEDEDLLQIRAREIFEKYFSAGSEWEINADHFQKIQLREQMTAKATREIFDDIQISIFVLMRMDSFPKFVESDAFLNHMGTPKPKDDFDEDSQDENVLDSPLKKIPPKTGLLSCISG